MADSDKKLARSSQYTKSRALKRRLRKLRSHIFSCVEGQPRQAKLLGLDLQDAIDHKKDGPKTLQELSGQEPMKALPMRSGIEGLEED